MPQISKPTLILYAADDPLFDPAIISELEEACDRNSAIDLLLTQYGGHVDYLSSKENYRRFKKLYRITTSAPAKTQSKLITNYELRIMNYELS